MQHFQHFSMQHFSEKTLCWYIESPEVGKQTTTGRKNPQNYKIYAEAV